MERRIWLNSWQDSLRSLKVARILNFSIWLSTRGTVLEIKGLDVVVVVNSWHNLASTRKVVIPRDT